jgi:hypothetical protein
VDETVCLARSPQSGIGFAVNAPVTSTHKRHLSVVILSKNPIRPSVASGAGAIVAASSPARRAAVAAGVEDGRAMNTHATDISLSTDERVLRWLLEVARRADARSGLRADDSARSDRLAWLRAEREFFEMGEPARVTEW